MRMTDGERRYRYGSDPAFNGVDMIHDSIKRLTAENSQQHQRIVELEAERNSDATKAEDWFRRHNEVEAERIVRGERE